MDDLTKAIGEFESKVVDAVNNCNLHPAVVELVLTNLLNQVKNLKNSMSDGGIQNGSGSAQHEQLGDDTTECNSSKGSS